LAVDATAIAFLKCHGSKDAIMNTASWEHPQTKHAVDIGIGHPDLSGIDVLSEGIEEFGDILAQLKY